MIKLDKQLNIVNSESTQSKITNQSSNITPSIWEYLQRKNPWETCLGLNLYAVCVD